MSKIWKNTVQVNKMHKVNKTKIKFYVVFKIIWWYLNLNKFFSLSDKYSYDIINWNNDSYMFEFHNKTFLFLGCKNN